MTANPTTRFATKPSCGCSACGCSRPKRRSTIWPATESSTSATSSYIENVIATRDWAANSVARASRLSIEFGRRFYAMQIEWIDWATEQVAAGTLQTGGPLPIDALPVRT